MRLHEKNTSLPPICETIK